MPRRILVRLYTVQSEEGTSGVGPFIDDSNKSFLLTLEVRHKPWYHCTIPTYSDTRSNFLTQPSNLSKIKRSRESHPSRDSENHLSSPFAPFSISSKVKKEAAPTLQEDFAFHLVPVCCHLAHYTNTPV